MEPRRILFCTIGYEPGPVGGAERQARLQAEELARRGHRVEVVTPRARGTKTERLGGVEVHRLPRLDARLLRTLTYLPVLGAWLLVNAGRFDLIHVHLGNLQADVAGVVARIRGVPLYVKLAAGGRRGEIGRLGKVAWLTRWVGLQSAARIQAISDEIAGDLARIGIPAERVVRIPNGLPPNVYRPSTAAERRVRRAELGLPTDGVLVLYAGRFARYKGLPDLVAAWRRLTDRRGATLLLVGEAALDDPVGRLPDLPGLIVRPWTADIAAYFRAADLYVHPSHVDGMPNVVLEAMASGLPVIATRVAAVPEMIEDGVSGRLVDIGDVEGLRAAMDELIGDPDARARLGAAAAERVAATYQLGRVVDRIEATYEAILGPTAIGERAVG